MKEQNQPIWLVMGESGKAPHSSKRFPQEKWIYLDPHLTESSLGIQGYVGNLRKIEALRNSIAYIVDDIGLITTGMRYGDFDDRTGGISSAEGRSLTCAILEFLWSFLAPGGILTTSSKALDQLNDKEKQLIRNKYEIKVCPKANAKPGSDLAFMGESNGQLPENYWERPEMLYLTFDQELIKSRTGWVAYNDYKTQYGEMNCENVVNLYNNLATQCQETPLTPRDIEILYNEMFNPSYSPYRSADAFNIFDSFAQLIWARWKPPSTCLHDIGDGVDMTQMALVLIKKQ
jgi:hypothetical protein